MNAGAYQSSTTRIANRDYLCSNAHIYLETHTYYHGQIEHERVRANWNAFSHFRFCHFDVGTISACTISYGPTPHSATMHTAARDRALSSVTTCESCPLLYFPASVLFVLDSEPSTNEDYWSRSVALQLQSHSMPRNKRIGNRWSVAL